MLIGVLRDVRLTVVIRGDALLARGAHGPAGRPGLSVREGARLGHARAGCVARTGARS